MIARAVVPSSNGSFATGVGLPGESEEDFFLLPTKPLKKVISYETHFKLTTLNLSMPISFLQNPDPLNWCHDSLKKKRISSWSGGCTVLRRPHQCDAECLTIKRNCVLSTRAFTDFFFLFILLTSIPCIFCFNMFDVTFLMVHCVLWWQDRI